MAKTEKPAWSFKNRLGRLITTHDPGTAENYRHDPNFEEVTATPTAGQADDDGHVKPYSDPSWTKSKLASEIEARNDAAGADETPIVVDGPGNKPELIAALEADDAARADAISIA